jgi:hypothetical protein
MMARTERWIAAALPALAACGGGALCDAEEIRSALEAAAAGSTVFVGRCTVPARFTVRSGVSLVGEDPLQSILEGTAGSAVFLEAGGAPARVAGLTIRSSGGAAIYGRGPGSIAAEDLQLEISLGVGLAIEDVGSATIRRVAVRGPVNRGNAAGLPYPVSPQASATHGLIALDSGPALADEVSISGFSMAGAALVGSDVDWRGGAITDNLTVGLLVESGRANLVGLELAGTFAGTRGIDAFNGVFTATASVDTMALEVLDSEGHGLVHDTGAARHVAMTAERNRRAAVWTQNGADLEVSGALRDNQLAGVLAVDAGAVRIHDAAISGTQLGVISAGQLGVVRAGDGVHLVRSDARASLLDLELGGNARVGALIELDGATLAGTYDRITVRTSSAAQFGVVAQNGPAPAGWDSGVVRIGTSAQRDQGAPGFSFVESVGPCGRPRDTAALLMGALGP